MRNWEVGDVGWYCPDYETGRYHKVKVKKVVTKFGGDILDLQDMGNYDIFYRNVFETGLHKLHPNEYTSELDCYLWEGQ